MEIIAVKEKTVMKYVVNQKQYYIKTEYQMQGGKQNAKSPVELNAG